MKSKYMKTQATKSKGNKSPFIMVNVELIHKLGIRAAVVYAHLSSLLSFSELEDSLFVPYIEILQKELIEYTGISRRTLYKTLKQLEAIGLIYRKHRYLGKSDLIYVSPLSSANIESKQFIQLETKVLEFARVSLGAKLLYSICCNTAKNYCQREMAARMLNVHISTISRFFNELKSDGLIKKYKQGVNKCDGIIVKTFKLLVPLAIAIAKKEAMAMKLGILTEVLLY